MNILTAKPQTVKAGRSWSGAPALQFADQTYGEIDATYGLLTIRQGQKTGADDDWGGQVVGSIELDKAIALLKAAMQAQEDAEFAAMLERWEAGQDARHDAVSAHFLHD